MVFGARAETNFGALKLRPTIVYVATDCREIFCEAPHLY